MKKARRFLALICSMALVLTLVPGKVQAHEGKQELDVNFAAFRFAVEDYNPDNVSVEYSRDGLTEISIIRDIKSGEILETITVAPDKSSSQIKVLSRNTYPYVMTRSSTHAGVEVVLTISVELYSNGSFRQVNGINYTNLKIETAMSGIVLENPAHAAWGKNYQYPATEVLYSYDGTLCAKVDTSSGLNINVDFLGLGFSFGGQVGTTTYYRLSFVRDGTIYMY